MVDSLARDTGIFTAIAAIALFIILLQLLLCFKAKKLLIKLIPTILLVVATVTFYAIIFIIKDRTAIGYGILAVISELLLFFDVVVWGVWGIITLLKKNHTKPE